MKRNIGDTDRILRIFVGLALIFWVILFAGPVWAWIGIVRVVTGLMNFCPAYSLLGINTCNSK